MSPILVHLLPFQKNMSYPVCQRPGEAFFKALPTRSVDKSHRNRLSEGKLENPAAEPAKTHNLSPDSHVFFTEPVWRSCRVMWGEGWSFVVSSVNRAGDHALDPRKSFDLR
jgi:hypothetical protein